MKHAEAARILDLADAPPRRSTSAVALALAILTIAGIFWFAAHEVSARGSLHLAHQAGSLSRSTEFGRKTTAMESGKMKKLIAIGVVSTAISASAMAQNAVQWRVEDGGNGHWYQLRRLAVNHCWTQARNMCEADGGHLATITSASENNLLRSLTIENDPGGLEGGPYIGGTCVGLPWGQFYWITGEPFVYTNWFGSAPNGSQGETEQYLHFWRWSDLGWNDAGDCGGLMFSHLIEYSADCNNDGIVDYGQIRTGEYADANANNIPDCCEYSTPCDCAADIIQDNAINGVDLAAIMNAWGTNGGKIPRCDVDGSGIVDGSDLTIVLDAWGPCP